MRKILLFVSILFLSQSCVSANGKKDYCSIDCKNSVVGCKDINIKTENIDGSVITSYSKKEVVNKTVSKSGNESSKLRVELFENDNIDSIDLKLSGFNKVMDQMIDNGKKIHDGIMKSFEDFDKDDGFTVKIPEIKIPSFDFDFKVSESNKKKLSIPMKNDKVYLYWIYDNRDSKRLIDRQNELLIKDKITKLLSLDGNEIVFDVDKATVKISMFLREDETKLDDGNVEYSGKFGINLIKGNSNSSFSKDIKESGADMIKVRDKFIDSIYKLLEKELTRKV